MKKLKIYFHTNTTDYTNEAIEWEVEQKNWRGFYLQLDDSFYSVSAIQPNRHNQEVQDLVDKNGLAIIDINEFIIKDVSKETIVKTVPLLVKEGFLDRLMEMSETDIEQLDLTLIAEIDLV
jgi:hypothetical protein